MTAPETPSPLDLEALEAEWERSGERPDGDQILAAFAEVRRLREAAEKVVALAVPGSVTHDHVCRDGCLRTAIEGLDEVLRGR